ncbi:MAG TPA: cytidylate kinase-like family protein [Streptosporangiaceae bacterium]|jgi:cytidylate kinase|nr:cytidylate kinase-like family protein [Streptosporangiaceae bacterium]
MPGVTISAGYGAGGSIIAPEVARQLGVPLLDRAISSHVAAQLQVSVQEAEGAMIRRPLVDRFFSVLSPLAGGVLGAGTDGTPHDVVPPPNEAAFFREQAEAIMREALASGAVILGRAGGAAFSKEQGVLRVRLFGSTQARIEQAARIENVDLLTARQRQPQVDRARAQYVRRLYCVSIDDPELYQLQIDSTALPLRACADLIAAAYRSYVQAQPVDA